MKTLLSALLVILLVFSLCGCITIEIRSSKTSEDQSSASGAESQTSAAESRAALPAEPGYFRLLTALEKTRIEWDGGSLELDRGTTALLPADGFDLMIAAGKLLLAYPTV